MSQSVQPKRIGRRRLSEIGAGHRLLRAIFQGASKFDGEEFENALQFARRSQGKEVAPAASVVRRLVQWYQDGNPGVTCRVIDAGSFPGGMLWLQSAVNRVARDLRAGRPVVLFITGLGEAVRSPEKRWTKNAERERQEGAKLIEEQVEQWAKSTGTPISLFVA